ncbi:hypothetical protein JKY79_00600 [Candidatus Babeliales bacterium]|nr:hypothetical protein [Candidatus Babeliales bacterium]
MLVFLYVIIDYCDKKIGIASGLEMYILYHTFFLLLDRLSFALYVALLLWLRSLIVLQEAERFLLLHISFISRVRPILMSFLIISTIGACCQSMYGMSVHFARKKLRESLVCKKKQKAVLWKNIGGRKLVRFVEGVEDRAVFFDVDKNMPDILLSSIEEQKSINHDCKNDVEEKEIFQFKAACFFWYFLIIIIQPLCTLVLFWIALEKGIFLWYSGIGFYFLYHLGYAFLQVGDSVSTGQKIWLMAWVMVCICLYGYMFSKDRFQASQHA